MKVTLEDVKKNKAVQTYIRMADESLRAMGYTEHGFAHVERVAETAREILLTLGYSEREAELASIAGYLHDIGNVVNREGHAQSGAVMAFRILDDMGADPEDTAVIITAIGNHDESAAFPVNPIAAALLIADKSDVRNSRVRNTDISSFDIHELKLKIDKSMCAVMDYFEIFLQRMILCRKSAEVLGLKFWLTINKQRVI